MSEGYISEIFSSIQGEGIYVGLKQLFVRFSCCNLRCSYCDTKDSWEKAPFMTIDNAAKYGLEAKIGNPVTPAIIYDIVKKIEDIDGKFSHICLTGGEPLEQPDFLQELIILLKNKGYPIYLETNALYPDVFKNINDYIDVTSLDVKILLPQFEEILLDKIIQFLTIPYRHDLFLKVIVANSVDISLFERTLKRIRKVKQDTVIVIQPIHQQISPILNRGFKDKLFDLQKAALAIFKDVRLIPQVHKFLDLK
jgi:7-carboxy-7-deazaguanine synthase